MHEIKRNIMMDDEEIAQLQDVPVNTAPLFVKIERYQDVITHVNDMRTFISGLKHIFTLMSEIENIRTDTLKIMRASVQRLERSVSELDSMMLRPGGVPFTEPVRQGKELGNVEDALLELQKQLSDLRRELQDVR